MLLTPQRIQYGIAAVFFVLGGWATFFPQSVIDTVFLPEFRNADGPLAFVMACFGAQALLAGLFAAFSRFTATTFLVYALALLPFFAFNWYFTVRDPVFNLMGLIDAVGNIIMFALAILGWWRLRQGERA